MSNSSLVSPKLGDRVEVLNAGVLCQGTVRFIGSTSFAGGVWYGLELEDAQGKNDGSIQGVRYFDCEAQRGMFVRQTMIKRILAASTVTKDKPPPGPASASATPSRTKSASATPAAVTRLRSPSPSKVSKSSNGHSKSKTTSNTPASANTGKASSKPSPVLSVSSMASAKGSSNGVKVNGVITPPIKRATQAGAMAPETTYLDDSLSSTAILEVISAQQQDSASENSDSGAGLASNYITQIQELESEKAALEGRVALLTSDVATLEVLVKSTEDRERSVISKFKTKIKELEDSAETERGNHSASIAFMEKEMDALRESLKEAKEEAAAAILQIEIAKTDATSPKDIAEAKEQLRALMSELNGLKQRVTISEATTDVLKAGIVQFDDDIDDQNNVEGEEEDEDENATEVKAIDAVVGEQSSNRAIGLREHEAALMKDFRSKLAAIEESKAREQQQREEAHAKQVAELQRLLTASQNENERLLLVLNESGRMFDDGPTTSDEMVAFLTKEVEDLRAQLKPGNSLSSEMSTAPKEAAADDERSLKTVSKIDIHLTDYDTFFTSSNLKQAALVKENEELRSRLKMTDGANGQINGSEESDKASLKDSLESLTVELEETKQRFGVVDAERLDAYEKLASLSKENETMKSRMKIAEAGMGLIDEKRKMEDQITSLTEELEDLRFRLKAAEAKRVHDRDQTKEIDKLKLELDSASVVKSNTTEKLATLNAELKAAIRDRDMFEQQLQEANDALELVTLDLQLSEERRESIAQELQSLKDQVEELNMDLDFVVSKRPEIELNPEQFEGVVAEINLLNNQNERLKDALIQFRDFSAMRERDLGAQILNLEGEISKLLEQQGRRNLVIDQAQFAVTENDSLTFLKLMQAEAEIEELKSTLNGADEARALVQFLTSKNLELGGKIENLKDALEDMEILQLLTEELEENHLALEKELIEEIDVKDGLMNNLKSKIDSQQETIADYERTIHSFRDLVKSLQEDLSMARMSSDSAPRAQIPTRANMDLMESAGIKAQYKGIDIEMRKLDVAQANEHLEILKVFLPDTFFKTEHVPILSLLLLRRMVFKCNLIKVFLEDNFLASKEPEQMAFILELRHKLFWSMGLARRLVSFLEGCSEEVFIVFGSCYTELIGTERKVDVIIDLLKIEEVIGQRGVLVEMQKCISHLEVLVDMFIKSNNSAIDWHNQTLFHIEMVDAIGDRFEAEIRRLESVFTIPPEVSDPSKRDRILQTATSFLEIMPSIGQGAKSLRIMTKKLHRMIDAMAPSKQTLSDELVVKLSEVHKCAASAIDYISVMTTHVGTYVREQFELNDTLSLPVMNQLASNASDALLKFPEDRMGITLVTVLTRMNSSLMTVLEAVDDPMNLEAIPDPASPAWLARATKIKSDYLLNNDLGRVIESLKADVLDLVTDLNEKKQLQMESNVKIEYLEKKTEEARSQSALVATLEGRVKKLMGTERSLMDVIDKLNGEKLVLELENDELKQNALRYEKMTTPQANRRLGPSVNPTPYRKVEFNVPTNGQQEGVVIDGDVAAQFESLKSALRFLRLENTKLKADLIAKSSGSMFKSVDPLMRRGLNNQKLSVNSSASTAVKLSDVATSVVAGITRDSKNLIRDILKVSATPTVVDISARDARPGKWVSMKADPMFQHQRRVEMIDKLVQRGEDLQDSIKKVSAQIEETTGRTLTPRPVVSPVLLGRVIVPKVYTDSAAKSYGPSQTMGDSRRLVLTSRKQWEELHSMFTR
ncbi:hypothetical protein HDU84_006162 [Entophlyctis sp. JEL0112]|nr:hypothetical protein HDU84_006162 [Entophlyctis sp. JEL0112]